MKNKLNILISFLLIFSFTACESGGEDILSKKQVADILVDISLLEGSFAVSGIPRAQQRKRDAYYESIFEKHNTTAEQFDKSLDQYAQKPKELEGIYKKANDILAKMEEKAEEEKKQADEKKKEEELAEEALEQEKLQQEQQE